jgi:hypothetical protein
VDALHEVANSTLLGPLADIGFNKDFKGAPIESDYEKDLPSNERYSENTSALAYALGQSKLAVDKDLSPKKIDHVLSGYLGFLASANKALFPVNASRRDVTVGLRNRFVSDSAYSTDVLNAVYDNRDKAERDFKYYGTPDKGVEYEKNAVVASYISGMNKAIKALPEEEQRNGRVYLLKELNRWNYDNTQSQANILDRLSGEKIESDKYVIDSLPKPKLEWTETTKDGAGNSVKFKYEYQMTPQEYTEYITDYLNAVETYRSQQSTRTSNNSDFVNALESTHAEVNKVILKKYKSKYSGKATKTKQ